MSADESAADDARQRIVRVPGSRRVRLTPAPGAQGEPPSGDDEPPAEGAAPSAGANDERMRREVPPHY